MENRLYALAIVGGRGERMGPLTDDRPKPMVEVNGIPIIGHQVEWMRSQGISDVVFLCGYKGEMIQEYFGNGSKYGITAHYSFEKSPLGRGGAVKQGLSMVPADVETVIVTNGDVITDQPLKPIIESHVASGATGTVMLVPFPSQYGVVDYDDNDFVTQFVEKGNLPYWINGGLYLFNRQIEQLLPDKGDHETTTFQKLVQKNGCMFIGQIIPG